MRRIIIPLFLLFGLLAAPVEAAPRRNSGTVRKERKETQRKIDNTRRKIQGNIEETQREYNRLSSIEADIRIQEKDISRLKRRQDSLTAKIRMLTDSVKLTSAKVETLKNSYAESLRAARSQRQAASSSSFIFSSKSFKQAYRRMRYLRELSQWQSSSAQSLTETVSILENQRQRLDSANIVLTASIDTIEHRRQSLEISSREARSVVASLKRQSKNLNKILEREQTRARRLDQELNRIIEEEARAAAEEARRKAEAEKKRQAAQQQTPSTKGQTSQESKGGSEITSEPAKDTPSKRPALLAPGTPFEKCKGKLPSPIDRQAKIIAEFGRRTHEELSRVEIQNNGVDFETSPGASAVAVHEGTVSMVIVMEGFGNVVLIRHGEYLTVYAGLSDLSVRKGDNVKAGQKLGHIHSDPNDGGRTRLHFEVRHEKSKLNPEEWLR